MGNSSVATRNPGPACLARLATGIALAAGLSVGAPAALAQLPDGGYYRVTVTFYDGVPGYENCWHVQGSSVTISNPHGHVPDPVVATWQPAAQEAIRGDVVGFMVVGDVPNFFGNWMSVWYGEMKPGDDSVFRGSLVSSDVPAAEYISSDLVGHRVEFCQVAEEE